MKKKNNNKENEFDFKLIESDFELFNMFEVAFLK